MGVADKTLKTVGAVSEETVIQMMKGAIEKLNVDFAVATSGIMGPDGGTDEKPVGTVWIAAGNKEKVETAKLAFRFDRERVAGEVFLNRPERIIMKLRRLRLIVFPIIFISSQRLAFLIYTASQ